MTKKLNYDMHLAIELRGQTWLEWLGPELYNGWQEPRAEEKISFRDSIQIAEHDGHSEFQPTAAEEVAYHCKSANGTNYGSITREEWNKAWRHYRLYHRQSEIPDISPAGERI